MRAPDPHDEPPSRIPWPPLLMLATLGAGAMLDALLPIAFPFPHAGRAIGAAVIVLALANDVWCAMLMARHSTTIRPDRAVSSLVTEGPYRWSRNPIYVSHVALTAGLGLVFSSVWTLLLLPALAFGLTKLAIVPEETHLSRKFGSLFDAYVARTRRWL